MALENAVSIDFDPRSSIVKSVFDSHLPGVCMLIIGQNKQNSEGKIVNSFLQISFHRYSGAQKNHLIATVLLTTHSICFGLRNMEIIL